MTTNISSGKCVRNAEYHTINLNAGDETATNKTTPIVSADCSGLEKESCHLHKCPMKYLDLINVLSEAKNAHGLPEPVEETAGAWNTAKYRW